MSSRIKKKKACFCTPLGLFYKFISALGTANGNFPLAPGYPNRLVAAGTGKIPVLPVPYPLPKKHIFPILPIALIGVAGKAAENS